MLLFMNVVIDKLCDKRYGKYTLFFLKKKVKKLLGRAEIALYGIEIAIEVSRKRDDIIR